MQIESGNSCSVISHFDSTDNDHFRFFCVSIALVLRGLVPHDSSRRFGAFDSSLGIGIYCTDEDLKLVALFYMVTSHAQLVSTVSFLYFLSIILKSDCNIHRHSLSMISPVKIIAHPWLVWEPILDYACLVVSLADSCIWFLDYFALWCNLSWCLSESVPPTNSDESGRKWRCIC